MPSQSDQDTLSIDHVMRQVMDAMVDGMMVADAGERILYVNTAYTRILKMSKDQLVGKQLAAVKPNSRMLETLRTGKVFDQELIHVDRVGVDIVFTCVPIVEHRAVVGAVSLFRNITSTVRLYQALNHVKGYASALKAHLTRQERDGKQETAVTMVGESPAFRHAVDLAHRVAPTDATVLVRGETGVGKELFAHVIHAASSRAEAPFVAVNCAAVPETLLESELFGYAAGAFTGAAPSGRPGKFQGADGGTLFLDEVGDMSLAMQAKLLRVLQDGYVEPVGGKPKKVDVRLVLATNRNLEARVSTGEFREDLYYRISVFPIVVPALRERAADLPLLARHFVQEFGELYQRDLTLSEAALDVVRRAPWPGNIRQLRNAIEHAVIMAIDGEIRPEHFPHHTWQGMLLSAVSGPVETSALVPEAAREHGDLRGAVHEAERTAIVRALASCGGNRTRALKMLGMSRRGFYVRLHKYGLLS